MSDELPYRSCVGIALFNKDNKVFVAERVDLPGSWQMPQGGIDPGELPEEAAMRELKEEIGTDHAEIIDRTEDWLCYDLPANLSRKVFKGKYRGQKQLWYAMRFKGEDSEINLYTEKPEFVEWKWVKLKNITELVIPFKKAVYESIVEQFFWIGDSDVNR